MAPEISNRGIFELKTAADLASKMRYDLARLRTNPSDTYAAFDFFVAARHLPDWLYPNDRDSQDRFFAKHVEMRISRHLADGAKHFEVTHPQHRQVASTNKSLGAWGGNFLGWASGAWGDGLFIDLDDRDADTRQLGKQISAVQLAERVMTVVEGAI
jgi:hypothetical protein